MYRRIVEVHAQLNLADIRIYAFVSPAAAAAAAAKVSVVSFPFNSLPQILRTGRRGEKKGLPFYINPGASMRARTRTADQTNAPAFSF